MEEGSPKNERAVSISLNRDVLILGNIYSTREQNLK